MAHTFASNYFHVTFSTRERAALIHRDWERDLWAYMGGIARQNAFKVVSVGGIENHVHLLLSLPPSLAIAKAVQLVKGGSSKWLRGTKSRRFRWQRSYSSFTVSASVVPKVERYIANQREHHKKRSFEDELRMLLKAHGIEYDEKWLWD